MNSANILKKFGDSLSEFIEICHKLYDNQLVCAYDGNVSLRTENYILITPTHICKKDLMEDDLVILNKNGQKIYGKYQASSEFKMHELLYKKNSALQCIVHAHPLYATAVFRKITSVDTSILSEAEETFEELPVVPFFQPGTNELAEALDNINTRTIRGCILENHGAVTWGKSIRESYYLMESLERLAKTHWILNQMK